MNAYVLAATRLPIARRNGHYKTIRPDDLLAAAIQAALAQAPTLDPVQIDEVIVGCAVPEAEQGLNVARMGLLLAGLPNTTPGFTINRFCASGLEAIALAAQRIQCGAADVVIAAGAESMSIMSNMLGNKLAMNPRLFNETQHLGMALGMGMTAENVAKQWKISREAQDQFAAASHQKALAAQQRADFSAETTPFDVRRAQPKLGADSVKITHSAQQIERDEGPRSDSTFEKLSTLRPVFQQGGSVTAGNASQMSDGAGALILVSEKMLQQLNAAPLARFVSYAVAGVPPEIMGIGPISAIPKALQRAGLKQSDLSWIELNEAFAAQALAVMQQLELDSQLVNPLGGAIALGHPLGATGAIRAATVIHGLRRTQNRYGMVTMCIGTGMGAAGIFERL